MLNKIDLGEIYNIKYLMKKELGEIYNILGPAPMFIVWLRWFFLQISFFTDNMAAFCKKIHFYP